MKEPSVETNRALEPLLIGLGQPGFTYGATYEAQGRTRAHQIAVDIAGYYEGSIDEVTLTTENTTITALSAEPYVQNPSLKALEEAKDKPKEALHLDKVSSHGLQRWQDQHVSTDEDSLITYYSDLQEQRIEAILEDSVYNELRTVTNDVEDVKEQQNEQNMIIRDSIDFDASERANTAESLQLTPWETSRSPQFSPETYFDAVHARNLTAAAYNAMDIELRRMESDQAYFANKGFPEVATKARRLKNTFKGLRNHVHELYQHAGLAESMLSEDQPRSVSQRGGRISERIEKETVKQLKHSV